MHEQPKSERFLRAVIHMHMHSGSIMYVYDHYFWRKNGAFKKQNNIVIIFCRKSSTSETQLQTFLPTFSAKIYLKSERRPLDLFDVSMYNYKITITESGLLT
jgi:hypothetical protein